MTLRSASGSFSGLLAASGIEPNCSFPSTNWLGDKGGLLFLVLDLHLASTLELIKGKGFENVGIISEIESVTCTFAEKDVDGKSV